MESFSLIQRGESTRSVVDRLSKLPMELMVAIDLIRLNEVLVRLAVVSILKAAHHALGFCSSIAMCSLAASRNLASVPTGTRLSISCSKSAFNRSPGLNCGL